MTGITSQLLNKSRRTLALGALPVIMLGTVLTASAASAAAPGGKTAAHALAAHALAAPAPASESAIHVCEAGGHHYCIGAPDLAFYKPVEETASGRTLDLIDFGTYWEIRFDANRSLCVAAANNGYLAVIHACNGGSGVKWNIINTSDGHFEFRNVKFSPKELAGRNSNGSQYHVKNCCAAGWDYKFNVV